MTNYLCVGIAKKWNEGEYQGRPYRKLRIYYTHDDPDRIDGVEAGYFSVNSIPVNFSLGCQFKPNFNRYGKIEEIEVVSE